MEVEIPKWDKRFLDQAAQIATWSKDRTKLGAVAVIDRRIVATGYNGFPIGVCDHQERYDDRETKLKFVVHAEMNAIYNAARNGVSLKNATLYVDGIATCSECAKGVIQSGIKKVVMRYKPMKSGWAASFELTKQMFRESGVIFYCYETSEPDKSVYMSLHSSEPTIGDPVEKNEASYSGYARQKIDSLEHTIAFPMCTGNICRIAYAALSGADGLIEFVFPMFNPIQITSAVSPLMTFYVDDEEKFWEEYEKQKAERALRRDESSGQANSGNETEPNIQETVAVGRRYGSRSDILRELSSGTRCCEDGVCSVGPTP